MLITCPTCAAVYRVDEGAIGPGGRNVQCDACGAQWRQQPTEQPEEDFADDAEGAVSIESEAEDAFAEVRPKTPGLEEAAELLQEMREESERTDSIGIFSDEAGVAEKHATPAPEAPDAEVEGVAAQRQVKSTIASANKRSPNADTRKGGGFRVGFIIALMFVAALAFAYLANDQLAEQFPGAASILKGYANVVDMIRGGMESAAESAMSEGAPALQ